MNELFENDLHERIEQALEAALPTNVQPQLAKAMRYSLLAGGKRIRPLLTLAFYRLFAKDGGEEALAMPFACAVEMVHSYSLIHDDLPCMDDDDLRRGRPSCHKAFGEATALLAGDALLTLAFETALSPRAAGGVGAQCAVAAAFLLAHAAGAGGMVSGQMVDLASEGNVLGLEALQKMDGQKTGALIRAACGMGCIAAGACEEEQEAAERYAGALGLAFQIMDDVLDATSTTEALGKPVQSDSENDKCTYITLMGLARAREAAQRLTEQAVAAVEPFGAAAGALIGLARELGRREN